MPYRDDFLETINTPIFVIVPQMYTPQANHRWNWLGLAWLGLALPTYKSKRSTPKICAAAMHLPPAQKKKSPTNYHSQTILPHSPSNTTRRMQCNAILQRVFLPYAMLTTNRTKYDAGSPANACKLPSFFTKQVTTRHDTTQHNTTQHAQQSVN